jgi:hypothetical protein
MVLRFVFDVYHQLDDSKLHATGNFLIYVTHSQDILVKKDQYNFIRCDLQWYCSIDQSTYLRSGGASS